MSRQKRTYQRDGFKLVGIDHPDPWIPDGGCYQVIHDELGYVGTVGTYRQMFEDRTPGKCYVNRRWHAVRWWFRLEGQDHNDDRGQRWNEGPGEAAKRLIWEVERERKNSSRP